MSYIGRGTESISNVEVLDNLTFDGSASYTLQKSSTNFVPSSANNLLISISGVVQQGNFSVSGSTITFDTTVSGSDTCDWILHYGTGLITTVADGAITEAKLGNGAVTNAKLANSSITLNGSAVSLGGSATIGGGKIGQVVSINLSSTVSISSSSTSSFFDISGLSVNITPTSTSSKIYISYICNIAVGDGSKHIRLMRDSTAINIGDAGGANQIRSSSTDRPTSGNYDLNIAPIAGNFLDSPNTTSTVTYKLQATLGSSYSSTIYINRTVSDNNNDFYPRTSSNITVMEVLA